MSYSTTKNFNFLPSLFVLWILILDTDTKSLMYSEQVFKKAVSAVQRPTGFLKGWFVLSLI